MSFGDHISEDTLELYSTGRLTEAEAAPVAEHLRVCEESRKRLEMDDEFIATPRQAVEEDPSLAKPRRRSAWARLKIILGLAIVLGYIYNIVVGGLPASDASAVEKWGYYGGTGIGMMTGILLVLSGLRRTHSKH